VHFVLFELLKIRVGCLQVEVRQMTAPILMRRKEALQLLGVSKESFQKMMKAELISQIFVTGNSRAYYLQEQVEALGRRCRTIANGGLTHE